MNQKFRKNNDSGRENWRSIYDVVDQIIDEPVLSEDNTASKIHHNEMKTTSHKHLEQPPIPAPMMSRSTEAFLQDDDLFRLSDFFQNSNDDNAASKIHHNEMKTTSHKHLEQPPMPAPMMSRSTEEFLQDDDLFRLSDFFQNSMTFPKGSEDTDKDMHPKHPSVGSNFPLKRPAPKRTFNVLIAPKRKKPSMWSKEEDERLKRAVEIYGRSNWKSIEKYVGTRSNQMCAQRWRKKLDPKIAGAKKGKWTAEEDEKLKALVKKHGTNGVLSYSNISRDMDFRRSEKQCRERWTNYLDPCVYLGPFTEEEDSKLLELARIGKNWKTIVKEMPGRTQTRLRRRLNQLMDQGFSR